jgi:hypothetical protein
MHRARPRENGNAREMRRATVGDYASTLDQPYRMAAAEQKRESAILYPI